MGINGTAQLAEGKSFTQIHGEQDPPVESIGEELACNLTILACHLPAASVGEDPGQGRNPGEPAHQDGYPPDTWRRKHLEVLVNQVDEFHEYVKHKE